MKIQYYGHVGVGTGYGVAATDLCTALVEAGIALEIRPMQGRHEYERFDAFVARAVKLPLASLCREDHALSPDPDVVIIHTLPTACGKAAKIIKDSGRLTKPDDVAFVAYTTWEGVTAPVESKDWFADFTQVWSPSSASLRPIRWTRSLRHVGIVPHIARHAVEPPLEAPPERVTGDRFMFGYVGAWSLRKNPDGLVKAYLSAFRAEEPVGLHLHCAGVPREKFLRAIHATGISRDQMPFISFSSEYLPPDKMREHYRSQIDCFVTASRGEAWNLPAFEAMLAGRNVIVPRGQGSDDYLYDDPLRDGASVMTNAVRYDAHTTQAEVEVRIVLGPPGSPPNTYGIQETGCDGLTSRCLWRDPDLVELAACMRDAFDARRRTLKLFFDPIERYGYAAVAKQALACLEKLR